jgi:murein DD-endopeptidase MepM/ murein hydrolase activator NlpD
MKPLHTLILSAVTTLSLFFAYKQMIALYSIPLEEDTLAEMDPVPLEEQEEFIEEPVESEIEWQKYTVKKGDIFGSVMNNFGLQANPVRVAALPIYDLANLRIGQEFQFQFMPGSEVPNEIRFQLGTDDTLIISRSDESSEWKAKREQITFTKKLGYKHFVVESSLWQAAINGGLEARDIIQIAQVLESDIDFNTEIQKGATAEILIEELWQDGKFVKLGSPLILVFTNKGKEYSAVRYTNGNDVTAYYDFDGVSREAPFLRSPLAFSNVTSNFNPKRFHPISKTVKPHNGTDFGAKTGTPVRSVADGVVTYAGSNGGHGNFVKIKHESPFETSYSHLSKINVKKGQKIKKGDVIGKVGSTGASTGPHLHYQVWKNQRFVDAMKVEFPKGKKLSGSELTNFQNQRKDIWTSFQELKSVSENNIAVTDETR